MRPRRSLSSPAAVLAAGLCLAAPATAQDATGSAPLPDALTAHLSGQGVTIGTDDSGAIVVDIPGADGPVRLTLRGGTIQPGDTLPRLVLDAGDTVSLDGPGVRDDYPADIEILSGELVLHAAPMEDGAWDHVARSESVIMEARGGAEPRQRLDLRDFTATLTTSAGRGPSLRATVSDLRNLVSDTPGDLDASGYAVTRLRDVAVALTPPETPDPTRAGMSFSLETGQGAFMNGLGAVPQTGAFSGTSLSYEETAESLSVALSADMITLDGLAGMAPMPGLPETSGAMASVSAPTSMDRLAFSLTAPRTADTATLELTMEGISAPRETWTTIDPDGVLPRSDSAVRLRLTARGADPAAMAGVVGMDAAGAMAPGDIGTAASAIETVEIDELTVTTLGVTFSAEGALDMPRGGATGGARPSGEISLRLSGLSALASRAQSATSPTGRQIASGLSMAQMMASSYLDPAGTDTLEGTLSISPGGAVSLNGQQLVPAN